MDLFLHNVHYRIYLKRLVEFKYILVHAQQVAVPKNAALYLTVKAVAFFLNVQMLKLHTSSSIHSNGIKL